MSKYTPSRRNVLLGGLAAGIGAAGFSSMGPLLSLARAGSSAPIQDRYYLFVYFVGGWDVILSLDPKDPLQFHEGNRSETLIQPGYDLLEDDGHTTDPFVSNNGLYLGPYIGDLANHDDKLTIIRGMSMETLTHEAGRRRFITGKAPSGLLARGSSGATWLAGLMGENELIPNLSLNVESYNVDQPTYASGLQVNSVPDLLRALEPGPTALATLEERQIDQLLATAALCPKAQRSALWQDGENNRISAAEMVESGVAGQFDFLSSSSEMQALRDHYGFAANNNGLSSLEARAAAAVQAIATGVSRVASVRVTPSLDTHYEEWTTDQGPMQEGGFNLVARMVEDLASRPFGPGGDSWLDHTTIVGFSEFSRTAMLNGNLGRDHSLTNACFLMGAGIPGGQVIGASSDVGMGPTNTDLVTGQSSPDGEVIKPEHVLRSLLVGAGIEEDVADLRVEPIEALIG